MSNLIKCRFCNWTTHKWGHGSHPEVAFRRLAGHIEVEHPAEDEMLDMQKGEHAESIDHEIEQCRRQLTVD